MEIKDLLPGIIGSFVGVMGWLAVGIYIQRRQFMRQARNATKAVYFELTRSPANASAAWQTSERSSRTTRVWIREGRSWRKSSPTKRTR